MDFIGQVDIQNLILLFLSCQKLFCVILDSFDFSIYQFNLFSCIGVIWFVYMMCPRHNRAFELTQLINAILVLESCLNRHVEVAPIPRVVVTVLRIKVAYLLVRTSMFIVKFSF